ncbi:hypothetical protein BDW71DRAFT_184132 [Aspergillus fruticulosus]
MTQANLSGGLFISLINRSRSHPLTVLTWHSGSEWGCRLLSFLLSPRHRRSRTFEVQSTVGSLITIIDRGSRYRL